MTDGIDSRKISFASGKRFVQSMRYQGLSDEQSIKEVVDNSVDAEAQTIEISIWKDDGINILVQDDGHGMSPELLHRSVAFGETGEEGGISRIGKFGFGLPMAICARTKTAEAYAKEKGGKWYRMIVDLNALEKDPAMILPDVEEADPRTRYGDLIKDTDSGVVVVFLSCDRLDAKKPKTIENRLKSDLQETYRYFLATGRKIYLNGEAMDFIDPLMVMKGHHYAAELRRGLKSDALTEEAGYSKLYELDPIEIECENENGEMVTGYVHVKLVMLPIKDIRRTGGAEKYGISMRTSGFYIVRNGRQIGGGDSLGLFTKHNDYNFFRGEISFDTTADIEVGIQANKSKYNISTSLRAKISAQVLPLLRQVVKDSMVISAELRDKDKKENGIAERIAKANPVRNPKAIRSATTKDIKDAIVAETTTIDKMDEVDDAKKAELKQRMRNILERADPFIVETVRNKNGPIFTWEYLGKTTKVTLNTEHPFYQYYWSPYQKDPYMETLLKVLLFTLVKGEQIHDEEHQNGNWVTYVELHNYWSMVLRKYLTSMDFIRFVKDEMPQNAGSELIESEGGLPETAD